MSEPNQNISIKSWAEDDRPREKLMAKGKIALSDSELIAILIGSGTREVTAVDLAKQILQSVDNNLNQLGRLNAKELCKFKGIGEAKAISIITALELGKRRRESEGTQKPKISSSNDAFQILQPFIGDLHHEEFWVLFLSNANKVLKKYTRLAERRNQKAKVLSGGERRLLEISRALIMNPEVLLVDEPSIGLEPKYIDMVFEILEDLQKNEKKTIILVEQNAKKGLEFADIGYVLVSGETAIVGEGDELLKNEEVGRLFLGG